MVGELGGVGQQVEEDLAELSLIGIHRAPVGSVGDDQGVVGNITYSK